AVVCAGAGDNAAAAVGTNTVEQGGCNISLGTSGTVFIPTDKYVKTSNPALHSFCHATGKWHLMGCILTAASANKWLTEDVMRSDYDDSDIAAEKPSACSKNLFFLPYLSGERCPHNDARAKGAFIGLTHETSRADLRRAVYEGVAFALKDCLELCPMTFSSATACGGGAKSKVWLDIIASVLDLPISAIGSEGPALGGAILAAECAGIDIPVRIEPERTAVPDPELSEYYRSKYKKYTQLYPLLKDFFADELT
ncbi:MAG: xylulokinase, partial [Clostridia bacterium]|nr:xylulokinase [Clostridia bacterium]